ncbi:hypothetical protein [Gilvibacter sp.]|uniref:hypothetical protein n=1 Tax=Gilvibacter sp. TaxID=2729997 RepID=UPI003B51D4E5
MIYLIDDKKLRQESFGWGKKRFQGFSEIITPLFSDRDVQKERQNIRLNGMVILYHDSFYDNPLNITKRKADDLKQALIEYSHINNCVLVLFSGSISARRIQNNIGYTPPAYVYRNLNFVLTKYEKDAKTVSAEDILFGENYVLEQTLSLKSQIWEKLYRKEKVFDPANMMTLIEEFNELTGRSIEYDHGNSQQLKAELQSVTLEYHA